MQADSLRDLGMSSERWQAPATRAASRSSMSEQTPYWVALAFLLIHVLLALLIDASDAQVFVRADRAEARMETVLAFLASASAGQMQEFLANHGILGDYAPHALLYFLGGRWAVVGFQVVLAVISGLCVYRLAVLLALSRFAATVTMAVYLCMPHSLVFAHQLATEALHVPLFVISTWLLAEALVRRKPAWLISSALLLGLATLVRPITLLWPCAAALVIAFAHRPSRGVLYASMAYLPIVLWMAFVLIRTGEFGLGKSDHSMERNLYERVARIIATLPPEERDNARADYLPTGNDGHARTVGPVQYLRFVAAYPVASFKHLMHDMTAFFAKSGVERVTIDYLALTPHADALQDPDHGWRQQLELHGWPYTVRYLWQALGKTLLISVIGAIAFVALVVLACIGAFDTLRGWRKFTTPRIAIGLLLVGAIAYTFAFSHVINAVQSRHRAPAEFAIVLLAAAGLSATRARRKDRTPSSTPTMSNSIHAH